ncbi:MAG: phosphoenolpyruvate carboxykinase, partial [Thaumarchaeota archaeon]|nr:phosphoenolpyruvate carboxykinase [Nitrososphaerota archaeon]
KIADPAFAAKVLADGRTIGHPAQARDAFGVVFATRYCKPFTIGVPSTKHVLRFYEMLKKRIEKGDPIEVYQFNTTGRIIARYTWTRTRMGDEEIEVPQPIFKTRPDGFKEPVGGTSPTIEETELFILQAARGAVEYEPHPVWGEKVLIPVEVEGLSWERLRQLMPTTYLSMNEFKRLLKAQIRLSKYYLDQQCPGLPPEIYNAMDF